MPAAVRMDDPVTHGLGMVGMIGGAMVGAVVGAAIIAAAPVSLAVGAAIVGGAVAGGALSMKQLIGGVSTIKDIPGPTTAKVMVGSANVSINGRPAAVAQLDLCTPCTGSPCVHGRSPVPVMLAEGSATVYINGKPAVRVGDQTMCGAKTKQGSSNVFIGGGTLSSDNIKDNEGLLQTGFEVLGVGALVGAGALAMAAGIGATAIFGAVVGGGAAAFKGLGALGNAMGPGYADLLQGSAGMGTVFAGPRLARRTASESSSTESDANFVWHTTTSPNAARGVLTGIDPKYLNPNSRFGRAFYVAEQQETTIAELNHHGATPSTSVRFSVNKDEMKVLDLTDTKVAEQWGYQGGPITEATKDIGAKASDAGFNAIRYNSERAPGGVNNAILGDFNKIIQPQMVTPAQP